MDVQGVYIDWMDAGIFRIPVTHPEGCLMP